MKTTTGVVLCGGRSSRMGRCKAWLPWLGRPMLSHVVDVLRQVTSDVVVVGAPDQPLPEVPARRVDDLEEGLGPLAGLSVGLGVARGEAVFVTATDAPHLTPIFIESLFAIGKSVAPLVEGRVQTMSAIYPSEAAGLARSLLDQGFRRPLDLLEAIGFEKVPGEGLPDVNSVKGFNTPEQYLAALGSEPPGRVTVEFLGRARKRLRREREEVPVGLLEDVLDAAATELALVKSGRVVPAYAVSLEGRAFLREASVPIGPGERLAVLDAAEPCA